MTPKKKIEPTTVYLPWNLAEWLTEAKRESGDGKVFEMKDGKKVNYKIDALAFVLAQIQREGLPIYEDERFDNILGFLPLNAKIVESVVKDYKRYLEIAEGMNIIRRESSYQVGVKSKKVGFTKEYRKHSAPYLITDYTLSKRAKTMFENKRDYGYPLETMTNHLHSIRIRKEDALDLLDSMASTGELIKDEVRQNLHPVTEPQEYRKYLFMLYQWHYNRILSIDNGNLDLCVSQGNTRLYSSLTNLKKEFRNNLYFHNADFPILSCVDIGNCQPFLLAMMFLRVPSTEVRSLLSDRSSSSSSSFSSYFKSNHGEEPIHTYVPEKGQDLSVTSRQFIERTVKGTFYEETARDFTRLTGETYTRDDVKDRMYQILFDKPIHQNKFTKAFGEKYPEIYEYVNEVKKEDYKSLALLLQRFEAWLMLTNVAWKLEGRDDIPYFTIHDAFCVPMNKAGEVRQIMSDAIREVLGVSPKIDIQNYTG